MKLLIYILIILTVALEAISEGLYDEKKKELSKCFQCIMILCFWGLVYLGFSWHMPVIYLLFRLLFFGMLYNVVRGIPYNYVGTTSLYDKYIAKYVLIAPVWLLILFGLIITSLKYFEQ